ncbi:MAG: PHP domain-containing protein [Halanaerobiales bacterium]|nr:PHP domain-containing protein [Halanaerobiales bacterium]
MISKVKIKNKFNKKTLIILLSILILLMFNPLIRAESIDIGIINPYEDINWDNINYYKANLHTHTKNSDGFHTTKTVIDEYIKNNYDILAITDHNKYTWPWEDYGVNVNELKISRIAGSEISNTHHLGSYFNDYASKERNEDMVLSEIEKRNGLAVFFHPGRYNKTIKWYSYFFKEYDHLVGIEVFNKNDRYPRDRKLWDRLLFELMPDNPVWGFANDDMHNIATDFGWHYNVFLLTENTIKNIKNAMMNGHFYIYNPQEQKEAMQFYIENISVINSTIELSIKGEYNKIEWISFNSITQKSEVIKTGNSIDLSEYILITNFIRAKITGDKGIIYTQPFGMKF